MARPHGRARVNTQNPEAFAQCDRCSFWYNRSELLWQDQWSATHLYNLGFLVCKTCWDIPFEQLRTIILPPDPPPIINARPPGFAYPVTPGAQEYGPIQGAMASTSLDGSHTLVLLPAEGSLQDAASFSPGDFVWIYLNTGVFDYIQITAVDATTNTLTLAQPLSARAPVNGSVTFATHTPLPTTPTGQAEFDGAGSLSVVSVTQALAAFVQFNGGGSLSAHQATAWQVSAVFHGTGSLVLASPRSSPDYDGALIFLGTEVTAHFGLGLQETV